MAKKVLSTPNTLVHDYFDIVDRILRMDFGEMDSRERRQHYAICLIMSVTAVETFLNGYFRLLVAQPSHAKHEQLVLNDLTERCSLDYKLDHWPNKVLNKNFNRKAGIGKRFDQLKEIRNKLMHFTSTHESVVLGKARIGGLGDLTYYHNLSYEHAKESLAIAYKTIGEILKLSGKNETQVSRLLNYWTGWLPA